MIDTDPDEPRLLKEGNLALPRRQLVKALDRFKQA
jgi:hypothetical protein